jgi:hypothetical protein
VLCYLAVLLSYYKIQEPELCYIKNTSQGVVLSEKYKSESSAVLLKNTSAKNTSVRVVTHLDYKIQETVKIQEVIKYKKL